MHMITFGPDEQPRSLQLYGVAPATIAEATKIIVGENLADMNFGCPKSTH
jgi:tRNA-dihydrouridine synthase